MIDEWNKLTYCLGDFFYCFRCWCSTVFLTFWWWWLVEKCSKLSNDCAFLKLSFSATIKKRFPPNSRATVNYFLQSFISFLNLLSSASDNIHNWQSKLSLLPNQSTDESYLFVDKKNISISLSRHRQLSVNCLCERSTQKNINWSLIIIIKVLTFHWFWNCIIILWQIRRVSRTNHLI